MSIKDELTKTASYLRSTRKSILARGGEISPTAGLKDLPNAIYNIPADSSLAFPSDDTVAYRKIVPVGAEEMARVETLGGMTYKCNNLIPYPYYDTTKTVNGITFTVNSDGSITANGTATANANFRIVNGWADFNLHKGDYYISGTPSSGGYTYRINIAFQSTDGTSLADALDYGNGVQINLSDNAVKMYCVIGIPSGTTLNNITFKPMLNAGSTALPYEPYFEGLRSAKVTSLKSEGANLAKIRGWSANSVNFNNSTLDITNSFGTTISTTEAVNSITVTQSTADYTSNPQSYYNGYFCFALANRLIEGKQYRLSFDVTLNSNPLNVNYFLVFSNGIGENRRIPSDTSTFPSIGETKRISAVFPYTASEANPEANFIEIRNSGASLVISNVMITEETVTDTTYKPYIGTIDTLAITEAVQSLPDYGEGVSAEYHNRIKFADKKYRQEVVKIILDGTESLGTFDLADTSRRQYSVEFSTNGYKACASGASVLHLEATHYTATTRNQQYYDTNANVISAYGNYLAWNDDYMTVEEMKAKLKAWYDEGNPLTVVYALAEPIETDISAYLTSDGFFKVQGGGTIIPENEYEYGVPSYIQYVKENTETGGSQGDGYEAGYNSGYADGSADGFASGKEAITSKLTDLEVTENGEYTPTGGSTGFKKVTVAVGGGENPLQMLVDAKGGHYLFGTTTKNTTVTEQIVTDALRGVDTSNATDFSSMFNNCRELASVPLFDTSNGTNMNSMFGKCSKLTSVPLFDMGNVTDMNYMFDTCNKLTSVPLFDTKNVTSMSGLFTSCYALTSLPLFDTSKVKSMSNMVYGCSALTTVPLFNTGNVTGMNSMFLGCFKLMSVPSFDMRSVTNAGSMLHSCIALTEVWVRNIKTNLQVGSGTSYGHLLTVDSLVHLCYECRDTGSTKTLTMGTANLAKLADVYVRSIEITDEMRAEDDLIDEKLPFVRCESTDEGATLISDYILAKNWKLA